MTKNKHEKHAARERAAREGTSYVAALNAIRQEKAARNPAPEAPKRTDKPTFEASLDGWLFAVHDRPDLVAVPAKNGLVAGDAVAPIFTQFSGSPAAYVVVYKNEGDLWRGLRKVGITRGFRIKQIVKTSEFVESIPLTLEDGSPIKIIWNLRDVGQGRTRWDEIQRGEVA